MTTNSPISSQSIGTGSNKGEGILPQKITLAGTTTAFVITGRVTNGAAAYDPANEVIIWYSTSSFSITAAAAAVQLRPTARYLSIKVSNLAAGVVIKDSSLEPVTGGYLYLWCDIPTFSVAATLDVNAVELP